MNEWRADFELLGRTVDGAKLVYLDSAATSLKPRSVLAAERAYNTQFTANIHRGRHLLSEEASEAYERARRRIGSFINAEPEAVIFVRNATEALNLIAAGLRFAPEDRVLAPVFEHHSNLVPWMRHARAVLLPGNPNLPLDVEQVKEELRRVRPRVLSFAHASHLSGTVQPVAELCLAARAEGVLTVVDAAQSAPHLPLDLEALGCDFLVFSGHKMLGPSGIGVLSGRTEAVASLEPLLFGGGMVDRVHAGGYTLKGLPHRLEAGTPNVGGALGLAAAVDYLEQIGADALAEHERALASRLCAELADLPHCQVLMAEKPVLALATVVPRPPLEADHLALVLSDSHKVMTRSGFFCARPAFDALGLDAGGLRASAYLYNTEEEVSMFAQRLRQLITRLS